MEEEIVILNWDLSSLSSDHMDILGELWKKRARQQNLQAEKKRNQVLSDTKDIFIEALDIDVNEDEPIMDQLVDIVHKYNIDTDGQEKIL